MMKETSEKKPARKVFSIKERFSYWFDNKMAKGSLGFIRILIIISVILAMFMGGLIILFRFNEKGEVASVYWDSMANLINASMPYFGDGSPGYLVMMSIVAVAGLLFTSVLIGIITSAIEEKIDSLKKGNSSVVERNHIVVLGFSSGEYTLLNQLILAAGRKRTCIVIANDAERDVMEQEIFENIELPRNVRIVCRTVDITDPVSIEKCSVETCKAIIVSPTDDIKTLKAVLAVSVLLEEKKVPETSISAIISREDYRYPPSLAQAHHISTLPTDRIIAKMIAHSCTQTGLSGAFRELFSFNGSEFYLIHLKGIDGLSFRELMVRLDNGVPVGILRDGKAVLNPGADQVLRETDKVLVLSEERDSARLEKAPSRLHIKEIPDMPEPEGHTAVTIVGHNEMLPLILQELPENVLQVNLIREEIPEEEKEAFSKEQDVLREIASGRHMKLAFFQNDSFSETEVLELAKMAEHIVILNDHDKGTEEADLEVIFLLLVLRDFRKRYGLRYNITIEMQEEHTQRLVGYGDHTDYLVSSSMSSLILAQLAENPELYDVFQEILSNEGNELYLKNAGRLGLTGKYTIRELRLSVLRQGYIFLGILDEEKNSHFTLSLKEEVTLSEEDHLIVLGEDG